MSFAGRDPKRNLIFGENSKTSFYKHWENAEKQLTGDT